MIRWSIKTKTSLYIVQTKWWRHIQRFVYSVYRSMRQSFTSCSAHSAWGTHIPESVGDWCNEKGVRSAYFRMTARHIEMQAKSHRSIDSAKVKFSRTPLDANAVSDVHSRHSSVHFKAYFYRIKIILATGRLMNNQITIWLSQFGPISAL